MIVLEYINQSTNQLVRRQSAVNHVFKTTIERFDQPVMLDSNLLTGDIAVYVCSPSAMSCLQLNPDEFKIVQNALILEPKILRRFTFLPGSKLIVMNPKAEELQIKQEIAEYTYVLLVKSIGEVLEKVKVRPKVSIDTFEKYITCNLIDEAGNKTKEIEIPVLDEVGEALIVQLQISSELFNKITPGEYPAIDLEFEYYQ